VQLRMGRWDQPRDTTGAERGRRPQYQQRGGMGESAITIGWGSSSQGMGTSAVTVRRGESSPFCQGIAPSVGIMSGSGYEFGLSCSE